MSNVAKSAHNRKDLSGQVFGKLTVISYSHTENKRARWNCVCECGNSHIAIGKYLICGDTKSCGCEQDKFFIHTHKEAGGKRTKEYRAWKAIKARCFWKDEKTYPIYGGRGITMCDRWVNSYQNFLNDMGRAPSKDHSIDRINNDGNYEPSNCRWATKKEQNNNSRNCSFISMNGETRSIAAWAELYGIGYIMLYKRIKRGWTLEEAIRHPPQRPILSCR